MKKVVAVTMALTLGLSTVPTAFAQTEKAISVKEEDLFKIQVEQQLSGVVEYIYDKEMYIKGEDGKRYAVILSYFTPEEIEKMGITEGANIFIEGQALPEDYVESFDYYKLTLPNTLTDDELSKIEIHFNKMREYDNADNYEASAAEWDEIYQILQPHFYMNWEPIPFEEYLSWMPYEFSTEDLQKLEKIYHEANMLITECKYDEGNQKMNEFYQILEQHYQDNYVRPSFAEYMGEMEFEISADDLAELERLYNQIGELEQSEDTTELEQLWQEFHGILEGYYLANYEPVPFEEFISYHEFTISDSDLEKIKPLYEQVIQFEKEGNWEESGAVWEKIYEVLNPYYELLAPVYIQASQVIVR